jgi:hypothetical protein
MSGSNGLNGHAAGGTPIPPAAQAPIEKQRTMQSQSTGFHKAQKFASKARVALIGVSGAGKSYTALLLAHELAGQDGKIAAVDSEHGSLSKYAGEKIGNWIAEFDVDEPDSYTNEYLLNQLTYAEENGYAVFLVDSLSHFWMGRDGALEFVDKVRTRSKDGMEGWKQFRPHERTMVDRFLSSPCHIIVTMRCKTDYEEMVVDGKKKRVKVGLAPVQREGLEYEFDLVGAMDDENNFLIDKTRCSIYSSERMRTAAKPAGTYFQPYIEWLNAGAEARAARRSNLTAPPTPPVAEIRRQAEQIDTGGHPLGTVEAAAYVAQQKIAAQSASTAMPQKRWATRGQMKRDFLAIREAVGDNAYLEQLEAWKVRDLDDFFRMPAGTAETCYDELLALSQRKDAA